MPISESPFCGINQHKLPTVYTDSAPNSLADCNHPTFPILGDNMEITSTSDWAPNIETIGCSLLNFEVSETETCDDSNFSDGFQNWSNSSSHAEVYLPTNSVSSPKTCADMSCYKASATDCGMQMLSLPRNEPTYTVINIHPNAYINSSSYGLSDVSGLFPQSITDLTVTAHDPNLLEVDDLRCANLNGHQQSFIPYYPAFNDGPTQQFSQAVGYIAGSSKQPIEDFAVQEMDNNLLWQNESCINTMPSNFSSDGFEVISAYLPPTSNFVYDVQAYNPECLDNNYYDQSASGQPLHGYDRVNEPSSLSNYALIRADSGNDAYYSSATMYSEGFVQMDPGPSNVVYQNTQSNMCSNTTILLPSFPGGIISPEETCIPAYWVSEASHNHSISQNFNYDQSLVTVPQTISFEGESVDFDCNPDVENVQAVEIPLAPFLNGDNQDRSIVNDVQTLCPKSTVFGQHELSLNPVYSGPNAIEFTTVTTINSANKSTTGTTLAISKETTSSLKNHKWSCTHCSRSFIRPSHLVDHLRTHTGERPFSCTLCGRRFTQASNLRRHLPSHKAWPIEPLVSSFKAITSLSTNSSKDTNLSPTYLPSFDVQDSLPRSKNLRKKIWNCRFCDHSFENYLRLRAHMVHHKDKQVFACVFTDCQSTFTLPNSLLTHLLEKHQTSQTINPQCRICGQTFHDFMQLVRHCLPRRSGVKYGCSKLIRSSIYGKSPSRCRDLISKSLSKLKTSKNSFSNIDNGRTRFHLIPLQTVNNSATPISYRCPICSKVCARVKGIRQHLLTVHADQLLSQAEDLRTTNDKSFIERFCFNMPSTNDIDNSLSTALSKETSLFLLRLENCVPKDKILEKQAMQSESVTIRKPPVKNSFICRICNKVFSKRKFFDDHELMCKQLTEERARRVRLRAFKQTKFRVSTDEDIFGVNNTDAVKSSSDNQLTKQTSESNIDLNVFLPTRRSTRNKTFRVFWKPKRSKPDFDSNRVTS